ncbi:MAG: hypothetical protein ABL869_03845 [Candidatus Nitrotoga sp.]
MKPTNPYTDGRFWRAYASLYWPDLNDNAELASFAKTVADGLPERQPGEPIRILALGFGFGGVELPILHYLKRITGAPLECVVIDKEAEPLRFAEILLENGIENIPPTMAEIARRFDEFPQEITSETRERWNSGPKIFPDGDSFRFIQDDLDWEPLPDGSPLPICPEPSRWADRLADTLGESHRYHVVFASFCFFHIGWWQRVLYDSLGAMVEGGLFLHGRVEGDEAIFEGRPGKRNSEERISNATKIFRDGIFADREVVKVLQAPRGASASRPFVIDEYLVRLEPFGLDRLKLAESQTQLRYTVRNNVGCDTYRDLLETRGFSTFRLLAKQLKNDERYKDLCNKALLNTDENCSDGLEIDFVWSVHKVSPRTLMLCPLHPLFRIEATWEFPRIALADAYKTEYALNGASSIHNEIGGDESDHALLAGTIGKKLNQQELLHPACLALQFGFIPRGADKPDFFYVPNFSQPYANVQERQIRELTLYQSILKSSSTISPNETYSNTQTLLDVALQKFSKPCIFAYHLGAKGFRIEHRPARDYEEIRFYVPPAHDTIRLELKEQLHTWMSSIKRLPVSEEVDEPKGKIVFTLSDFEVPQLTVEAMTRLFFKKDYLSGIVALLRGQIDAIETLEQETIDALKETITVSSVFRSACLQFLEDTKLVVFYPASYEVAGTSSGRDLVIASYREHLTDASVESEYHKFNQVFEKVRFVRQEKALNIRSRHITAHESKNIAISLLEWPVAISKEPGQPILTAPADSPWRDVIARNEVALLPHPAMFKNILETHILWTMANSISDLPFSKAETFDELVASCWETVFLGFQANVYKSLGAIRPDRAIPYRPFLYTLRYLFSNPPFEIINRGKNALPIDWNNNQQRLINLARLFIWYFREYIQHADWNHAGCIEYCGTDDDDFEFSISNLEQDGENWRAEKERQHADALGLDAATQSKIFDAACHKEPLFVFDPDRTPFHGEEVARYIASQLHGENTGKLVKREEITRKYSLQFRFSTKPLVETI